MGIIVFIYGLLLGSFLNVCIYRIPRGESISYPPSHCTNCSNKIKPYDLIPVVSYIFLRGKCRYCKETISVIYPLIELTNALLYLALYYQYGLSTELIKYTVLVSLMIVIGMIDLKTTDVYFSITVTGVIFAISFIVYYLFKDTSILTYIYGALLGGGIISLIILIAGGMGWGDAEICLLCGLFLGLKLTILTLLLSFVIGSIAGIFLILTKRKGRKDYIAFGPYIALASIISVLYGSEMMNWYLGIMRM